MSLPCLTLQSKSEEDKLQTVVTNRDGSYIDTYTYFLFSTQYTTYIDHLLHTKDILKFGNFTPRC